MITKDYHVHSTFSDGKDEPEKIVLTAIEKGMTEIGFSDHSYTYFDECYCIKKDQIERYKSEIRALKEKYKGKIKILLGVEQDYYSDENTEGYDFVIGSVHYVKVGGEFIPVDDDVTVIQGAVQKYFGGDVYAFIEQYYKTVADVVPKTHATIIGHFDLITKNNELTPFFDEQDARYVRAWRTAVDECLKYGVPFEINTGAMSRGYKTHPYPSDEIRAYITAHGGTFVQSSDSHSAKTLCYGFK